MECIERAYAKHMLTLYGVYALHMQLKRYIIFYLFNALTSKKNCLYMRCICINSAWSEAKLGQKSSNHIELSDHAELRPLAPDGVDIALDGGRRGRRLLAFVRCAVRVSARVQRLTVI